jgi:hypothetical protein
LSRHGLDRDSPSRRHQRVSLDSRENLDSVKKLVSTIKISRSRLRLLDFVSTTMSRPKSLDQDWEIRRDLKFSAFLDSLSRSRPRSAWIFVFSRQDFSIRRDFRPRQCQDFSTNLDCVLTNLENLDASRQILTISTRLDKSLQSRRVSTILTKISTRQSLDWKISILKISTEKKKKLISTVEKSWQFKKVSLDTKDVLDLDLDWSRLSRPPGLLSISFWFLQFYISEKIRNYFHLNIFQNEA